ncbi:MAG: hypothetical protein ROO76_23020 [Terriglobia bacterium]|nr:hypothetical protein [Terriglobia bacterium]
MNRTNYVIFMVFATTFTLVGCKSPKVGSVHEKSACQQLVEAAEKLGQNGDVYMKERVKRELVDPDSAQFRNVELFRAVITHACDTGEDMVGSYTLCGEVNSKNRFGGYAGYTRFYSVLTLDLDGNPAESASWTTFERDGDGSLRHEAGWFEEHYKTSCRNEVK